MSLLEHLVASIGDERAAVQFIRARPEMHYACDPRPARNTLNPSKQRSVIERRLDAREIVDLLLEYGADRRARDANGNVPRV